MLLLIRLVLHLMLWVAQPKGSARQGALDPPRTRGKGFPRRHATSPPDNASPAHCRPKSRRLRSLCGWSQVQHRLGARF